MTFAGLVNLWVFGGGGAGVIVRVFRALPSRMTTGVTTVAGDGFTGAYPRANKLGGTVLYGNSVGFMVYLATVLAGRLGQAGAMGPAAAAEWLVPAVIGVGLTELLSKEDGRT